MANLDVIANQPVVIDNGTGESRKKCAGERVGVLCLGVEDADCSSVSTINIIGIIKAGFAGGDRPKIVFSSAVGRPKHVRMMPGGALEGSDV
jgi:actin-related protein